jgi:acyl carrier protein
MGAIKLLYRRYRMVFDKVKKIIVEQLDIDELEVAIGPDSKLEGDLGASDDDILEIVMAAEEEFAIEISSAFADTFSTVGELVDYITENT